MTEGGPVGGKLSAQGPVARGARWDGFIPIGSKRADGVATPEDR